jgi:hypothetical protein
MEYMAILKKRRCKFENYHCKENLRRKKVRKKKSPREKNVKGREEKGVDCK